MKTRPLHLITLVCFFVIVLTVLFTRTSWAESAKELLNKLRAHASPAMIVNEDPIQVEDVATHRSSTHDLNVGQILLTPNQTMVIAEATGSGTFQDVWIAANTASIQMTITIDSNDIWKDDLSIFCLNTGFNKQQTGFAGFTSCGESTSASGPVWSGYVTPNSGYQFQHYFRIAFKNTETTPKVITNIRGHYTLD